MTVENRFQFNKTKLNALSIPKQGRTVYHDTQTPGLVLRVTAAGQKSFCFYRKVNGSPTRVTLGTFPEITVEKARKACNRLNGAVADGRDPAAELRQRREEITLEELWKHWEAYARSHKRSWKEDTRMYDLFLSRWAKRRLSAIHKGDVAALHNRVALESGKYQANRVFELLRAMYNRGADKLGFRGENPAVGITKFSEEKRDRFLHGDELKAFFEALAGEPNDLLRDFFWLLLLTGARRGNLEAMRWDELDFSTAMWRIPHEKAKAGKVIIVPLTGLALSMLQARREACNGSEWVFPSKGKTGHLVEPKAAWKRILHRARLTDLRPHDLRRSLASHMAMSGVGLQIVGKMLGHTQARTTEIYARVAVDPVRQAAELATAAMLKAGGVKLLGAEKGEGHGQG